MLFRCLSTPLKWGVFEIHGRNRTHSDGAFLILPCPSSWLTTYVVPPYWVTTRLKSTLCSRASASLSSFVIIIVEIICRVVVVVVVVTSFPCQSVPTVLLVGIHRRVRRRRRRASVGRSVVAVVVVVSCSCRLFPLTTFRHRTHPIIRTNKSSVRRRRLCCRPRGRRQGG